MYARQDYIKKKITNAKTSKCLDLSNMTLGHFPMEIIQLDTLEELHLNDNQITELPENMGSLTSLKVLSLHGNQLKRLPDSLWKLTELSYLTTHYNIGPLFKDFPRYARIYAETMTIDENSMPYITGLVYDHFVRGWVNIYCTQHCIDPETMKQKEGDMLIKIDPSMHRLIRELTIRIDTLEDVKVDY